MDTLSSPLDEWFYTHFAIGNPKEIRSPVFAPAAPPMVLCFSLHKQPGVCIRDLARLRIGFDDDCDPIPVSLRSYLAIEITVHVPNFAPETFSVPTLVNDPPSPPRWMTVGELAYEICKPQRQWARVMEYHKLVGLQVPQGTGGRGCTIILSQ